MSAGKPSAINVNGWIKDIVEQHECGFYVDPTVRGDLVNKSIQLVRDTALYNKNCTNARTLAMEQYDRNMLAKRLVDATNSAIGNSSNTN